MKGVGEFDFIHPSKFLDPKQHWAKGINPFSQALELGSS
jgi:hypothetical protein